MLTKFQHSTLYLQTSRLNQKSSWKKRSSFARIEAMTFSLQPLSELAADLDH